MFKGLLNEWIKKNTFASRLKEKHFHNLRNSPIRILNFSFLFQYNACLGRKQPEAVAQGCPFKVTHLTTEAHSCRMSTAVMSMFWWGHLSRRPSRGMPPALQMASLFLVPLQQLLSASRAHRATSMFFPFFAVRLARLGMSCSTWT